MDNEINRKSLKQSYKEAPPTAGVYLIKNKQTGMNLMQSAQNAKGVINRHLFELKFGQHRNPKMQQDWHDYGAQAFEFMVVKNVKPDAQNIRSTLDKMLNDCREKFGVTDDNSY